MRDVVIYYTCTEAQDPIFPASNRLDDYILFWRGGGGVLLCPFILIPHLIMCDDEAQKEDKKI